jgi:hypothetical protein
MTGIPDFMFAAVINSKLFLDIVGGNLLCSRCHFLLLYIGRRLLIAGKFV